MGVAEEERLLVGGDYFSIIRIGAVEYLPSAVTPPEQPLESQSGEAVPTTVGSAALHQKYCNYLGT